MCPSVEIVVINWLRIGMFLPEIDATGTDYAQYSWSRYHVSHGIVVIGLIYACSNRDS